MEAKSKYRYKSLHEVIEFATKVHSGQVRKFTGEQYINHPLAVMQYCLSYCTLPQAHTQTQVSVYEALCAAVLHDVLEDTSTEATEISSLCNFKVAYLVNLLTYMPKSELNRKQNKSEYYQRVCLEKSAAIIKLFDMLHNSRSLAMYDPNFYKVYFDEFLVFKSYAMDTFKEDAYALEHFETVHSIMLNYVNFSTVEDVCPECEEV